MPSATYPGLAGEIGMAGVELAGSGILGSGTTESVTIAVETGASGTWQVPDAPAASTY